MIGAGWMAVRSVRAGHLLQQHAAPTTTPGNEIKRQTVIRQTKVQVGAGSSRLRLRWFCLL